jgi:hypothetical protein
MTLLTGAMVCQSYVEPTLLRQLKGSAKPLATPLLLLPPPAPITGAPAVVEVPLQVEEVAVSEPRSTRSRRLPSPTAVKKSAMKKSATKKHGSKK